MIIVNQDRNEIINFGNVERIDITVATNPFCYNVNFETDGTRDLLGNYATEERAKEVLQEIVKKYEKINLGKYYRVPMVELNKELTFVYVMPEK